MGTGKRFRKLIQKGPKVQCSFSGLWDYYSNTNSDERGGRRIKKYDFYVQHPTIQKSKFRSGAKWQRGYL